MLTANAVRPLRHHARYVRSLASRVRRVASTVSSTPATLHQPSAQALLGMLDRRRLRLRRTGPVELRRGRRLLDDVLRHRGGAVLGADVGGLLLAAAASRLPARLLRSREVVGEAIR